MKSGLNGHTGQRLLYLGGIPHLTLPRSQAVPRFGQRECNEELETRLAAYCDIFPYPLSLSRRLGASGHTAHSNVINAPSVKGKLWQLGLYRRFNR